VETLGGLLLIVGIACIGGGLLMDSNYGGGVEWQSAAPLWRGFRIVGVVALAIGLAALGLAALFG
jgi:hypothetical protein